MTQRQRWALFTMFALAGVLNLVDRQTISVLKPEIAAELGWSDNDYGTLAAWFQGSMAIALLGTGWLADRLGVRWANAIGVFSWSVVALFHAVARSLTSFIVVRAALGATEAMATPAGIKMMAGIFPPHMRSTGFGIANAISSVSGILAPILIPLLAVLLGWRGAFLAAGALGIAWAGAWLVLTRRIKFERGTPAVEPLAEVSPKSDTIFRDRYTYAIAGAKVLSDSTWFVMLFWMPDLLHRQFGLTGVAIGPPLALAYAGAAAGALIGGTTSTYLLGRGVPLNRVRKGVMLVSALFVLPLPLVLSADGPWGAAAILALVLAAHQSFSTNLFALITDVAPQDRIGRVVGFGAFAGNVGGTVIVKVAGLVLAAGLGYLPLLAFCAVSYLLAIGWIQLLLPHLEAEGSRPTAAAAAQMAH